METPFVSAREKALLDKLQRLDARDAALRALVEHWLEEVGPRVADTRNNFPAGHDMTEYRFVTHKRADELLALLDGAREGAKEEQDDEDDHAR